MAAFCTHARPVSSVLLFAVPNQKTRKKKKKRRRRRKNKKKKKN